MNKNFISRLRKSLNYEETLIISLIIKRAWLSRRANSLLFKIYAQVNSRIIKHKRWCDIQGARQLVCIPDSLSVSKLLQGRTEEDVNETTVLITSDKLQWTNGIFHTDKLPQHVRCFYSPRIRLCVSVQSDRAWLSERIRHLTARRLQFCFQSGPCCVQPRTWRTSVDAMHQTPATCLDFNTCSFLGLDSLGWDVQIHK